MYNPAVMFSPGYTRQLSRPLFPLVLALLVAAFVTLYPQLDAMGYCDDGGCPDVSQSTSSSGASGATGGAVGTGSGSGGAGHTSDAQTGSFTGLVALVVLAGIPTYAILSQTYLLLESQPAPERPGSLLLSPDSPPPRP